MYNHLITFGIFTSKETIKMAEDFVGKNWVKETKKKVKNEIFLTNEVLKDDSNGSITVCCINYPQGYKEFNYDMQVNFSSKTPEEKDILIKDYINDPIKLALECNIVRYYSVSHYYFEDVPDLCMTFDIQTMKVPDTFEKGDPEIYAPRYLKEKRLEYYIDLLKKEYDKRVDEMDKSTVYSLSSKKLNSFNSEDF